MATVINNPPTPASDAGSGMGFFVGLLVVIILAVLFFVYALPAIRNSGSSDTNINVPDRINVDVNQ